MHKQVSGWTVNFGPNSPVYPLLQNTPPHFGKLQIWDDQSLLRNTPPPIMENFRFGMTKVFSEIPPPIMENFRFGMTKVYSEIPPHPPHFGKLQIWDDQSLLRNTPHYGKLQIWDDQSLLRNTPIPILENFRFGMTKVYSEIPPHYGKLQIWDDQSLLWNTPHPPPFWKTSDLGWPKFTLKYPPIMENFRFGMTKVYSGIPPPHFGKLQIWDDQSLLRNFGKLQIWDDQSLLRNTPPFWKTSDLGWPKFTPEYPPIMENFRFGMTKVYSGIPPPIMENFRFGMTKVYSGIPPPTNQKLSESSSLRFSEYRKLLHVETLSNPDNY